MVFLWGHSSDVVLAGVKSPPAGGDGQQVLDVDHEQLLTDGVLEVMASYH